MSDDRMTTFRAIDAYAVEAYRVAGAMPRRGDALDLAAEIRRSAARAGAAVVAAGSLKGDDVRSGRWYEQARGQLAEARYYLYLARRFGLIDGRAYRGLTLRQDAALRELTDAGSRLESPKGR